MTQIKNDKQYYNIVRYIMENENFLKIDDIEHHGTTRLTHSIRVSYYSYKVSKFLRLDYKNTATGGLLHDFFISDENRTKKDRLVSTFVHPKHAVKTADEVFSINKLEKDIIKSHMFPFNYNVPKYGESWIVNLVDKFVGTYEFLTTAKYKLSYATNIAAVVFINLFKF